MWSKRKIFTNNKPSKYANTIDNSQLEANFASAHIEILWHCTQDFDAILRLQVPQLYLDTSKCRRIYCQQAFGIFLYPLLITQQAFLLNHTSCCRQKIICNETSHQELNIKIEIKSPVFFFVKEIREKQNFVVALHCSSNQFQYKCYV